jgi:hypothetical protein
MSDVLGQRILLRQLIADVGEEGACRVAVLEPAGQHEAESLALCRSGAHASRIRILPNRSVRNSTRAHGPVAKGRML